MKFNPSSLGHRVLIKPFIETMSKGGIAIARSERDQAINTDRGEVVLLGNEVWFDKPSKPDIKIGDKVVYAKYGGKLLEDDAGVKYIILNDEDILVGYTDE